MADLSPGWLLAALGVVLVVVGASHAAWTRRRHRWCSTIGTLHDAAVGEWVQPTPDGLPGERMQAFRVEVSYSYVVDGRAYIGHQVGGRWDRWTGNGATVRAAVARRFAAGRPIEVYFALDNPSRAVLDPTPDRHTGERTLMCGIACIVVGIAYQLA